MSFTVSVYNKTHGAIVANGQLLGTGGGCLIQNSDEVITQIPNQGVVQLNSGTGNFVTVTSSYYKNEFEHTGTGYIYLTLNADFTFTIGDTPIQNVPLQTNRIAGFPFFPLESQSLPTPWSIRKNDSTTILKSLNSEELNFFNDSQHQSADIYADLSRVNVSKSVQVSFLIQVNAFPSGNNSDRIYLPGDCYLQIASDGTSSYYFGGTKAGSSSIRLHTGQWHEITVIMFPNLYVLIEDGNFRVNHRCTLSNPLVYFGCMASDIDKIDFSFSKIEIGTPLSLTEQTYDFAGIGNIWSDNYRFDSRYNSTNWVQCDNLIATIYSNSTDQQVLVIIDVKTGNVVVKKSVGYTGKAYRSPFVDTDLKYICFPVNNQYYFVYDVNQGIFVRENVKLFDKTVKYSEEVCYFGVIYFLDYNKKWHAYNILTNQQTQVGVSTKNSILRILKPVIQNNAIYAAMYTKNDYTEVVACDITNGAMASKWHYSHKSHIWCNSISCDNANLYYWGIDRKLYALSLSDGTSVWCNSGYTDKCKDNGSFFAPITNRMGALYIITDAGEIVSLSPDNGKTSGTAEKPFAGKTFNVGEPFLKDSAAIYPSDSHSMSNLWSHPKIVNGHLTFQGNTSKSLYSVNLDTGILQKSAVASNCYVDNFTPNSMTTCINGQEVNVMQMQQYDRNFYFDAALMADEYERDPKTDTVRPKASDNSFYTVTCSIQDNQGVPIDNIVYMKNMGERVTIISSLFETEYGQVVLEPLEQLAFKPGIDGKFKFKIPATSLYCPALHFWSDFMLPNVRIAFFPNQSNVDVLRKQQSRDVLNARNYEGEPVFEENFQNSDDADAIVQMIGNSVGGSILDDDMPNAGMSRQGIAFRSLPEKARIQQEKTERIRRRARLKQDLLTARDYHPNITMDYCAFAEDTTDNCLCSNNPESPVIDQPYIEDATNYTPGEFLFAEGDLIGPIKNIKYDPDREKIKWRRINAEYQEQIDQFLTEHENIEREEAEEELFGFAGFVRDCIVDGESVRLYHWQPQDEGIRNGFTKTFHVIIRTARKTYRFIVNTVEKGLQVLQSFFQRVAKSILHVIQWLSWVLNWKDVLNCQQNLQNCIIRNFQQGLAQFGSNYDTWIAKIDNTFDTLQSKVDVAFNQAETFIGGYNFDDVTQDYRNPRTITGEGGDNITNQANYLNDQMGLPSIQAEVRQSRNLYYKYLTGRDTAGCAVLAPEMFHPKLLKMVQYQQAGRRQEGFLELIEAINAEIMQFAHLLTDLLARFEGQISGESYHAVKSKIETIMYVFRTKVNTIEEFFQTCMIVLLDLFKSFINMALEAARLLITDLILLIPKIIDSLMKIMLKPIRIPGITALWNFIVGEEQPLTILSFTTLLIALPMTLTLKLLGQQDSIFFEANGIPQNQQTRLGERSTKSIKIGIAVGNAVACLFYGAMDTVNDILSDPLTPIPGSDVIEWKRNLQIPIIFFDLAIVGMTFPTYIDTSEPYFMDYVSWGITLLHNFMEMVFTFGDRKEFAFAAAQPSFELVYAVLFDLLTLTNFIDKMEDAPLYGPKADCIYYFFHCLVYSVPVAAKPLNRVLPDGPVVLVGLDVVFGLANSVMYTYYAVKA